MVTPEMDLATPLSPASGRITPETVVLLAGVTAALHIGKLPPALPILRDTLHMTLVQTGFLLSLVQLAGMSLGLAVGLMTDGLGLRRSVVTGLSILALAGLMGAQANSAETLLALRAMEGCGFLLVTLPGPSLIRRLVPPTRLSLNLGLWGTFMPTGTSLALLIGPWLLAAWSWPAWWDALAALSAAMAAWVVAVVPPDFPTGRTPSPTAAPHLTRAPGQHPQAPVARVPAGEAPSGASAVSAHPSKLPPWTQRLSRTLGARGPWLVALSFAVYSSQWLAMIGFLPSIYAQAGLSGTTAGALTALASAVNIIGNVSAGRLLHRGWPAPRLLTMGFTAMLVGSILSFGLPEGNEAWRPAVRYAAVLMFSAVGGLIPGALFSLAVRLAPSSDTVATTNGWMQQCSSTGQFVGPPLVAWLATRNGTWQWTWLATGACSIVGLLLAAQLTNALRRQTGDD